MLTKMLELLYEYEETLGSSVIAKNTLAQVSRGDRIVDGVLMESVDGVNKGSLKGSGFDKLSQEQKAAAMNDPRGASRWSRLRSATARSRSCGIGRARRWTGVREIRESGAFRNLVASQSEAELKRLASSGNALFERYLECDLTKSASAPNVLS